MKNIVLTGMSGVGKSRIGKTLAKKLGWSYVDTDELIIRQEGITIEEIFNNYGEEYFRGLESTIIQEVSTLENHIISTGGGVVLEKINMDNLSKNGYIFLLLGKIHTIVDNLNKSTTVRPLLNDKERLYDDAEKLFNRRKHLYQSSADFVIEIDHKEDREICDEILDNYYSI